MSASFLAIAGCTGTNWVSGSRTRARVVGRRRVSVIAGMIGPWQ